MTSFPTAATIHPYSSTSAEGVDTFGASYPTTCRLEARSFVITSNNGEVINVDAICYAETGPEVANFSKIVIGSESFKIVSSRSQTDIDGVEHHKRLLLARLA
jgi:hypothetical protein